MAEGVRFELWTVEKPNSSRLMISEFASERDAINNAEEEFDMGRYAVEVVRVQRVVIWKMVHQIGGKEADHGG